jgi:hypothetical protein
MDLVVQALMLAVRKRSMKDIKPIIDGGIGPINEYLSTSDDKPLYVAALLQDIAIVKYLVDSGMHVTNHPLMWDCVLGNKISTEIFKILFSQLKSEIVAKNGGPEGVNEAVFTFLQDARDQNKSSPRFLIEYAGIHSSVGMMSLLLSLDIPVTPGNCGECSVIHEIIRTWNYQEHRYPGSFQLLNTEKIRMIIEKGVMFEQGTRQFSVLEEAIMLQCASSADLVRMLLSSNQWDLNNETVLPPSAGRQDTVTPLILAINNQPINYNLDNQVSIVSQLLEAGVDCMKLTNGVSPLFYAVERNLSRRSDHVDGKTIFDTILDFMTKEQVQASATLDSHSLVMQTLLPGLTNIPGLRSTTLAKLLEKGANPDALDGPTGRIPIFVFMLRSLEGDRFSAEEERTMQILLNSSVDLYQPNSHGMSVVDLVELRQNDWNLSVETYRMLQRKVDEQNDLVMSFGMVLHPNIRETSNLRNLPPEMIETIIGPLLKRLRDLD